MTRPRLTGPHEPPVLSSTWEAGPAGARHTYLNMTLLWPVAETCRGGVVTVQGCLPSSQAVKCDCWTGFSIAEKISWCSQKMDMRSTDQPCSLSSPFHRQSEQTFKEFPERAYRSRGSAPCSGISRKHQVPDTTARGPEHHGLGWSSRGPLNRACAFGSPLWPPKPNHFLKSPVRPCHDWAVSPLESRLPQAPSRTVPHSPTHSMSSAGVSAVFPQSLL